MSGGVHPRLAAAFAALDANRVGWCLLRGRDDLLEPRGDVDLLLHPAHASRARAALEEAGFAVLRISGGGNQRFFLGWDRASDSWVYIHATSEVSFGPSYGLRFDGIERVLDRTERVDGVPMPSPDDRFWITLLHALLDKGGLREKHRRALGSLAPAASADGDLARLLDRMGAAEERAATLLEHARAGRWAAIEALGPGMLARWRHRDPAARWRAAGHRLSLLAIKLAETVTRRGVNVALLAPDGAGKSTLADALPASFYFPVRRFYLGLEGGPFAGAGRSPIPLLGFLRRLAYLWSNYLAARYHQARRRFVIFDRYPYDALLPAPAGMGRLSRARRALLGHALPSPDVVLVLDAPGEVLHRRKPESTPERLERDRQGYLELARRRPRFVVVDATRPFPEVRRDVTEAVWGTYRRRYLAR